MLESKPLRTFLWPEEDPEEAARNLAEIEERNRPHSRNKKPEIKRIEQVRKGVKPCSKCAYGYYGMFYAYNEYVCTYCLTEGKRRPCSSSAECVKTGVFKPLVKGETRSDWATSNHVICRGEKWLREDYEKQFDLAKDSEILKLVKDGIDDD